MLARHEIELESNETWEVYINLEPYNKPVTLAIPFLYGISTLTCLIDVYF